MGTNLNTAMILAAGFGTRLKPLTDRTPKALLKINGKSLLQILIEKLIIEGITKLVVNTHHYSDQIIKFLLNNDFGIPIHILKEDRILGTGGAIKNAEKYLGDSGVFLVHNVDVISDINISEMQDYHLKNKSLITLAIQRRDTSRPILFDSINYLIGRLNGTEELNYREPTGKTFLAGFCGIHIVSSDIFNIFNETGFFDIFKTYFRLVSEGQKILGFDIGDTKWEDVGTLTSAISI